MQNVQLRSFTEATIDEKIAFYSYLKKIMSERGQYDIHLLPLSKGFCYGIFNKLVTDEENWFTKNGFNIPTLNAEEVIGIGCLKYYFPELEEYRPEYQFSQHASSASNEKYKRDSRPHPTMNAMWFPKNDTGRSKRLLILDDLILRLGSIKYGHSLAKLFIRMTVEDKITFYQYVYKQLANPRNYVFTGSENTSLKNRLLRLFFKYERYDHEYGRGGFCSLFDNSDTKKFLYDMGYKNPIFGFSDYEFKEIHDYKPEVMENGYWFPSSTTDGRLKRLEILAKVIKELGGKVPVPKYKTRFGFNMRNFIVNFHK